MRLAPRPVSLPQSILGKQSERGAVGQEQRQPEELGQSQELLQVLLQTEEPGQAQAELDRVDASSDSPIGPGWMSHDLRSPAGGGPVPAEHTEPLVQVQLMTSPSLTEPNPSEGPELHSQGSTAGSAPEPVQNQD